MNDDEVVSHGQLRGPSHLPVPQMRAEVVIDETVAAAIAAHAASTVVGVARLEPGLSGLITHLAGRARQQVRHGDPAGPAPTEGVEAEVRGSTARVHVDLATTGNVQAADAAHQVQAAVAQALLADAGLTVTTVTVSILDIGPRHSMESLPTHGNRRDRV